MKTLIIGASSNPERTSYDAVETLVEKNLEVVALGARSGSIGNVPILTDKTLVPAGGIDTVGLYVNAGIQPEYYDFVLGLRPRRIFFNPGTENPEFYQLASAQGIECLNSCMVIALNTDQY